MEKFTTDIETDDFALTNETKYYAKLFTTYTNINESNHYNDCQIVFRVYHLSSTSGMCKPKEFIMTFVRNGSDIIEFRDLNPEETVLKIGYTVNSDGIVTVYGKGNKVGAKIKLQVLYATTIGMFKFYNNSEFINNPEGLIFPSVFYEKTEELALENGWTKDTYINSYYSRKERIVFVNTIIYDGIYSEGTLITTIPYTPQYSIYIPCSCYDNNNICVSGILKMSKDGKLTVINLPNNKRVVCSFSYFTI